MAFQSYVALRSLSYTHYFLNPIGLQHMEIRLFFINKERKQRNFCFLWKKKKKRTLGSHWLWISIGQHLRRSWAAANPFKLGTDFTTALPLLTDFLCQAQSSFNFFQSQLYRMVRTQRNLVLSHCMCATNELFRTYLCAGPKTRERKLALHPARVR